MIDYLSGPVVHEAFFKKYASKKFIKGKHHCTKSHAAANTTQHLLSSASGAKTTSLHMVTCCKITRHKASAETVSLRRFSERGFRSSQHLACYLSARQHRRSDLLLRSVNSTCEDELIPTGINTYSLFASWVHHLAGTALKRRSQLIKLYIGVRASNGMGCFSFSHLRFFSPSPLSPFLRRRLALDIQRVLLIGMRTVGLCVCGGDQGRPHWTDEYGELPLCTSRELGLSQSSRVCHV